MAIEDRISDLRAANIQSNGSAHPNSFQYTDKQKIAGVLNRIDRGTQDQIDVVFALLDDVHPSWFTRASGRYLFSHGASTVQIANDALKDFGPSNKKGRRSDPFV